MSDQPCHANHWTVHSEGGRTIYETVLNFDEIGLIARKNAAAHEAATPPKEPKEEKKQKVEIALPAGVVKKKKKRTLDLDNMMTAYELGRIADSLEAAHKERETDRQLAQKLMSESLSLVRAFLLPNVHPPVSS